MADRDIVEVIDRMLAQIPPDQKVIELLGRIRTDACFMAPEVRGALWEACAQVLNSHLGRPDTPWKEVVAKIFSGQC